jgi:SNF2 family DNA or RNA helicase
MQTSTSYDPPRSSKNSLTLTPDQAHAVDFINEGCESILIAPTGCGKTIVALHAILDSEQRAIVAAPPSVIHNWPKEAKKWGFDLSMVVLEGPPARRINLLKTKPDVLVVSLNNLDWLLQQKHDCTMIVIDELSKAAGKQTAKLKHKISDQLIIRVGMTATPVSESFEKLYAMFRIIDKGRTFGTRKDAFLQKYFYPTDYKQYNWKLQAGADKLIMEKAAPFIHNIPYSKEDTLPPITRQNVEFVLPNDTQAAYNGMANDMILEDLDAVAPNAAVMTGKLRQIASGFVMDENGEPVPLDEQRAAVLWATLRGKQERVIVLYEYIYQREQIAAVLSDRDTFHLYGGGPDKETTIQQFKDTPNSVLVAQYQTMSHGVDGLQHVCNEMLFYQPLWSRDSTEQAEGRVYRQGQAKPVTITTLVAKDTVDELVVQRVEDKGEYMKLFLGHIKGEQ